MLTNEQLPHTYHVHEAYSCIGRQVYGAEWHNGFADRERLPDQQAAMRISQRGGADAEWLLAEADPTSDTYEETQAKRFRESHVLEQLLKALEWGKTTAFQRAGDGRWEEVSILAWTDHGSGAVDMLKAEIRSVLRDGAQPPDRLQIDKELLDRWLPNVTRSFESRVANRRRSGRPSANWEAIRAELSRRHREGQLPPCDRGWRVAVAAELADWYQHVFPEDHLPKNATFIRVLNEDLDQIEAGRDFI